jgi:hypothetical protein
MSEPQEVPAVLTDVAAAALALALAVQLARREGHGWPLIGAFMGLPADRAEAWFGTPTHAQGSGTVQESM